MGTVEDRAPIAKRIKDESSWWWAHYLGPAAQRDSVILETFQLSLNRPAPSFCLAFTLGPNFPRLAWEAGHQPI